MKNKIFQLFFTTLLLLSSGLLKAQVDNLHYIPPFFAPPYIESGRYVDVGPTTNPNGNYFHRVVLSTSVEDTFEVNIRTKINFIATVSISKATPSYVDLPTYPYYHSGNNTTYNLPKTVIGFTDLNTVLNDQGLILEANYDFYVNISQRSSAQGDILTSKGGVGKGRHFFSGHIPNKVLSSSGYRPRRSNFVSVMATEDNTQITFSNPRIKWNGQTQNSFTVTLQKEETYVLGAWLSVGFSISEDPDKFNGTEITSTKDIVVNSGSWCGSVQDGNAQDMGFDQLVPVKVLGTEFIAVKGEGSHPINHSEKIIVVSPYDNNTIVVNGGQNQVTLNKGEYHMFSTDDYSANQNIYLNSTYGTYVYQSLLGGSGSNPTVGFIFIPKLSCEGYKDVSISYINSIGTPQLLLVARKGSNGETPIVKIDGIKIDSALSITGKAVTGNSDWLTYKISNSNIVNHFNDDGDWNVTIESNYAINAALSFRSGVIGGGGYYSGFGTRPSIETAPRILNTNGCAPGNMELIADNSYYTTYQWYKNGVVIPSETNSVFYPSTRGIYSLKGLTDCGLSRESDPVDIKTCIYWESKDGSGMDVEIWEDPTVLVPPEDPFVLLEFTLAEALDFDIYIQYKTTVPSYITYPATPGVTGDFIPIDYNAQIHIPADSTTGYTDPIWIMPDFLDEENEQFGIEIIDVLDADGNLGAVVQDDEVLVTILDDDSTTTTVSIEPDFSVIENEGYANFTISLTENTGRAVYVDYKTEANTAQSSNDYYSKSGTLTFLEGEMEKTISVPIINLTGFNGVRDFSLILHNPSYCLLGNDTTVCTIMDKEGEDVFLYYVNDTSSVEGNPLYFNIRITQELLEPLSFRLALLEGTANEDDFDNNTINTTTLTANVNVLDENKVSVTSLSFDEGIGDGVFYLQLSNSMDVPVTVSYKTVSSTSLENIDYYPINNMLIFMPGDSIKEIHIPIIDDQRRESNEHFLFQITDVINSFNSQNIWEVNILDNDPLPSISLEQDKSVLEDEGFSAFKVSLSNKSNDTIKVIYSTSEYDIIPKATPGDGLNGLHDFKKIDTERLTFLPGDSVKYINAEIFLNDGVVLGNLQDDESPEKFYVQLVNVEDATTASINSTAKKSIATIHEEIVQTGINKRYVYLESDETATEGDNFTFTINRFTGNINSWRVQVALTNNNVSTTDFTSTPPTAYINIAGSDTIKNITISTLDDNTVEVDENFTLQIVAAQYKQTAADSWTDMDLLPNRETVYGTIIDNDIFDDPQLSPDTFYVGTNEVLSIAAEHGVLENDVIYAPNSTSSVSWLGSLNASIGTLTTLASDGSFTYTPALDYEGNFSIDYTVTTSKGNTVSASVYVKVTEMPERYYINPGDTLYQIEIPTFDDALEEGNEQFSMAAFDLSSTSVRILPGRDVSTGTIIDDDFYPIVTNDYFYVNEDNALYPPTANILDNDNISAMDTLTEIILDTTGVYLQHGTFIVDMALDGTFTYMPNAGFSGRDSFLYTVRDSRTDSIYSPTQTYDDATAVVIIDIIPTNDYPIAIDDAYAMDEDDTGSEFKLTENDIDPDNVGLSISDIWGNSLGTVQIMNDSTILYDPVGFGIDTMYYRLDDLDSYDDPDTGMVIIDITGEEDRSFTILRDENILETNASPTGTMTFTVTMSNTSYKTRTIAYRTLAISGNSSAETDFVSSTGTLTYTPGTTQQTVDITVMGRGTTDNYDHRFIFELYNPSAGTYLGTNKTANGTIINVEPGLCYLMIDNDVTVEEGDTAIFTVILVGDSCLGSAIPFTAITSNGTAIGSIDYIDSTFAAGSGFTMPNLTMSSASGSFEVNEGDGYITIDFDLDHTVNADVTFSYTIHNAGSATATNEEDYLADMRFVDILAGETHYSINIPIIEDELDEKKETFFIDLANPINVNFSNATETIKIIDNDPKPYILLAGNKSVFETEGLLRYPIRLSRRSGKTVKVDITTDENGTAQDGDTWWKTKDYNHNSKTIIFEPGEDTIQYFEVDIENNNDGWFASDTETFRIYATNPKKANLSSPNDATITIYDSNASNLIYIGDDVEIANGNNVPFNFDIRSTENTYRYKISMTGQNLNVLLKNWIGDYPASYNSTWIYSNNNNISSLNFETQQNISNLPTQSFDVEIVDAEYGWGSQWNFHKQGNLTIIDDRKEATATIVNNITNRYAQNNSYVIHPGQTLSVNLLGNNNMQDLTISNIQFLQPSEFDGNYSYWPFRHVDNTQLGNDGTLTYTPPVDVRDNSTIFTGEFTFIAIIKGHVLPDYNTWHEYNDTITIYVIDEAEATSGGANLPSNGGSMQLKIPTIDDSIDEADEDFFITLGLVSNTPSNIILGTRSSARGVIIDNDEPPVGLLQPDLATCYEQQTITFNVLTNDDLGNLYNFLLTSVANPTNGTIVSFNANGNITYTSNQYFTGVDEFSYTATSDQGVSYPMNISILVESIKDIKNQRSLYCVNASSNVAYTIASPFNANTFEVWMKPAGTTSGGIANLGGSKTISRNGSGNVVLGGFTGTIFIDGIAGNTLVADKWQHLLITSTTAFNVSAVTIGSNGTTGMEAYYDELRIWNKTLNSQSSVEQIMFQELYYTNGTGQLKSLITNAIIFNPGYAGWQNLLFYAKFNSTDFWDVIGWSTVSSNGTTSLSMDLPFNHYLPGAIDNNWGSAANWHFGKDYSDALSPEYIILQPASSNNPYLHLGSGYSVNSETTIKSLVILENADFTMDKGSLRITGNVFRKANDRVVFMRGSNGMRISKSLNVRY